MPFGLGVLRHFPSGVCLVEAPMDAVDRAFGWLYQAADCLGRWLVERAVARRGFQRHRWHCGVCAANHDLVRPDDALEATGYMARVGFLGDRFLERLGLSGRSVVPLIGGMACAVPAVMAARTIPGKREQLITILVTPLMTWLRGCRCTHFDWVCRPQYHGMGIQGAGIVLVRALCGQLHFGLALAWALNRGLPNKTKASFHGMARLPMAAGRSGPRNGEQRLELCVQCRSSHLDHLHGDLGTEPIRSFRCNGGR